MKHYGGIIFFAAMIVGIIALISYAEADNTRKRTYCEEHGGTWFYHEQRCIPLHSIPIPTE